MNYITNLSYAVENNLLFEEVAFLTALYHIQVNEILDTSVQESNNLHKKITEYYTRPSYPWVTMINNLIEKGYVVDYRKEEEKDPLKLNIKKIRLTDKFKESFFIDKDEAYREAVSIYPDKIKAFGTNTKQTRHEKLKQYYYFNILKGGDKSLHYRFIAITKELFSFDERTQKCMKLADTGWQTYLESFEHIAFSFEKEQTSEYSGFDNML